MTNASTLIAQIAANETYVNEDCAVTRNEMIDAYCEQHWDMLVAHYGTEDDCEVFEALKNAVDVEAGICIILQA
jgi:hypothetical protein